MCVICMYGDLSLKHLDANPTPPASVASLLQTLPTPSMSSSKLPRKRGRHKKGAPHLSALLKKAARDINLPQASKRRNLLLSEPPSSLCHACGQPLGLNPSRCIDCQAIFHSKCAKRSKKLAEIPSTSVCPACTPKYKLSVDHEDYPEQLKGFEFDMNSDQKLQSVLVRTRGPRTGSKTVSFFASVCERQFCREQMGSSGIPLQGGYSLGIGWDVISRTESPLNDESALDPLSQPEVIRVLRRHPCSREHERLPRLSEDERKEFLEDVELSSAESVELDELRASRLAQFCQCANEIVCANNPNCPCNIEGVQCHVELGTHHTTFNQYSHVSIL